MRFLLFVLLFLSFAYSLGLVLANNTEVGVNLLFSQAPTMNLGLLLILCLILGIVIGILLALLIFRVLQNKWEISRLQKANANLQEQINQANVVIDRQANSPTVDEAVYGATAENVQNGIADNNDEGASLTKKKRDY
ncbi:LapA family protein [Psychrobacter sp. AOP22-C1-22]|uniref:LapA family protein n=1 Tax=unclassified Psychrobacter TaxID=196806 RepID=UPI001787AA7F|nr:MULTISPECIES: LapA family protein [unclassified Psychrobacter]MBE0405412.1 LapA family protein [Psychrobacter sp. FME6]MBE0444308.1 LapA family protein [Psychrobacter sp. FME5]MDN5800959.1 LapA family protein [Psychrobacter sp.]MDN5891030.1 LapA family protein [Psychrobacter sp.]